MSSAELIALLPLFVLGTAALLVLLAIVTRRRHGLTFGLTLLGLAATGISLPFALALGSRQATPLLTMDGYAIFYAGLITAAAFVVTLLTRSYFRRRPRQVDELYALLLIATLGGVVLGAASHMATLFLGIELLSVPLFAMVAYTVSRPQSLEAGLKYLILAAAASSFLLFGIALIYAQTGALDFSALGARLTPDTVGANPTLLCGFALLTAGLGFKISVVPFHLWTPDVYQGAPAPVTAFLASVSKTAVFAVLMRAFIDMGGTASHGMFIALNLIAIASMLGGNLLALMQNDVKRILAYSSIAHLGYLFVALLAGAELGLEAVTFYLAAYVVTILGAFAVVSVVSNAGAEDGELTHLNRYRGLFWTRPWLAAALTFALLSLAGIPLTMGFVGKFYLFAAGVQAALWPAMAALIAGSVIGLFYYLRVVAAMATPAGETGPVWAPGASGAVAIFAVTVVLVLVGVFPDGLMQVIQHSAGQLAQGL